jgi:hypothetical protein
MYKNINTNVTKQGYGTKSYLKSMLTILKVMEGLTFIYIPLGTYTTRKSCHSQPIIIQLACN